MTIDQYRQRWRRRHKKYEKQAYKLFISAFRDMALDLPWNFMNSSNYKNIIETSVTQDDLTNAYYNVYNKVGKQEGEYVGKYLNKQIEELTKEWTISSFLSIWERNLFEWLLTNTSRRIIETRQTFINYLNKIIAFGINDGKTLPEIAKELTNYVNNPNNRGWIYKLNNNRTFYRWEALRIARTETTAAANYAATVSGNISGVMTEKVWISAQDPRTRRPPKSPYDHYNMNGVKVGAKEPFNVSGENLMYPGDPKASAGNVINCRCASAIVPKRDQNGRLIRSV